MKKKLVSIIIPVYRTAQSLAETHRGIMSIFKEISHYKYEIIFINDGSDDNSLNELIKIKKENPQVKIIDFVRNFGQASAIVAGMDYSKGDCIIHISSDLQDPPELIPLFLKKWEEGVMIVAGERSSREDDNLSKITSRIFYLLMKLAIPKMPSGGFDYFLLDKKVYKEVIKFDERNSFLQGDYLWIGYEPYFIPYKRRERKFGKSQWGIARKIKYFIDGIIATSYIPIRFMSFVGLLTSFVGFLYAVVVFFARISNNVPVQGYAPIIIVLLVFLGLIMVMLGIIGEYIWRIYDEIKKRPRYIVRKTYL